MLSLSLSIQMGQAREAAKSTMRLALLLETDVLLSFLAAATCLSLHFFAPPLSIFSQFLSAASLAYLCLSIGASWRVATRFVADQGDWTFSRKSATFMILAPSALGPPLMCALVLPYTFPHYTRRWAYAHFALALVPALLIALFGKSSPSPSNSLPIVSTPLIITNPLLTRQPYTYRTAKPVPIRVALLRGTRFLKKKPMIHPLVKRRQFRPESPLQNEVVEQPSSLKFGGEWV